MLVPSPSTVAGAVRPPAACKMLTAWVADLYTSVPVKRILENRQGCAYAGGKPPADETISLHVIGPLPVDTARKNYDAAYRAAKRTAANARRLRGFGPGTAFGYESSEQGRASAAAVFLSGNWTVEIAISGPESTGDATIHDVSLLLKRPIWPRWTARR